MSHDRPLSPERVCCANSVQDGDRSLCATLCPGGGFLGFRRPEGHIFPETRSSVVEEAIEVPVRWVSLQVQGSVLRTVDCPSGLHQGICSGLCMGSLPLDSSSVPGRLTGPRLFGGCGQKERPGSALALSLPRDSDKQGEVRSCSLADCKLPRYNHRYRGRQDFSCPGTGREISVDGGEISCFVRSPCLALAGAFGAPGFTGEVGSSQSSSNALPAVAFEDALVSRVGSSLAPGASVPGGERVSVLVDGEGPSFPRGSIWDTSSGSSPVLGRVSVRVGRTPPRSFRVLSVGGGGEVVVHQPSRDESNVSGIAVT